MTQTEQKPKRSIAEWVTFGISSLILAIIVSLVGYTWLNEKNQPPILSVTKKEIIREINGQFYVSFKVVNSGGDTAESVQIMAELLINGKVTETGEQQIDFLSSGESEEGAFIFSKNPRQGELNMRVGSYKLP
ncbi:TIGR02588 family protein [Nostoc sp.]|uniref:TIGR02588 family protein n=1 Tax=Nostoc sp. TaxID=1180 RepID=UPI002FF6974C